MKQFLEAGEFVTTHGVTGELRVYPWSDSPQFLVQFERFFLDAAGTKELKAERVRPHKNLVIIKLAGVDSIEEARSYIGRKIYIARADADIGERRVFVQDLLGAAVVDADTGTEYGRITAVTHPGKHDVYEVTAGDKVYLFPAVEEFLAEVDVEGACVRVRPIPGMFDTGQEGGA